MKTKVLAEPVKTKVLAEPVKTKVLAEPVLVGRERELEELNRHLTLALKGKGNTVFISGEAGSGKTRLTREFLNIAKKKGIPVLSGLCLSDAAVPYLPFVEAFNSFFGSFGEEEEPESLQKPETLFCLTGTAQILSKESGITSWLIGQRPVDKLGKLQALSPQVWKDQVFDGVVKTLHAISAQQPIVLFIEDLHWADSASLALLHYIARAITSDKILVLATYRSEELIADAEGHPHPLAETLRMMNREDLFTEIKLSNLDHADICKIAEDMIGGNLQEEFAEKLGTESRGNPLFVVESLRMLSERKSLVRENDEWRLAANELAIPTKVRDIILRRLANLKYAQRRVLDAASVIGEKFDVELLNNVLGLDSLEILETLNVIAHSTSLVSPEENFYRFDHARSRETIYEELSPPLKKGYHARVAERLENSIKSDRPPFAELSYHYAQAGNKEKAVRNALEAGQDALVRFSNAEAIKHFNYVLQNLSEQPENAEKEILALEGLGDAYYINGLFAKAIEMFERLADVSTGKVKLRAYRKAMDAVFFGGKDPALLIRLGKQAEPYAASDRLESARIRLHKASDLYSYKTLEEFEAALKVFEEEYSLPDIARALEALGATTPLLGEENGLSMSLRSTALFEELGDLRGLTRGSFALGNSYFYSGLLQEALDERVKLFELSEKIGDYYRMAQASLYQAQILDSMVRFGDAFSKIVKAGEYSQKTDATDIQVEIYAYFVTHYARLGDIEHAEEYFMKLQNFKNLHPETEASMFDNWVTTIAESVFFSAKNQWDEAVRSFDKAFKNPLSISMRSMVIPIKIHYSWALNKQGRAEESSAQRADVQKFHDEVDARFSHVRLDAGLLAPWKVVVGEEFEMRLDLVNVSRKPGLLVRVESLVPTEFKVITLPTSCRLEKGSFAVEKRILNAFQVKTFKLNLKASEAGAFSLQPQVTYLDEKGENKTCKTNLITITVQPTQPKYEVLPGRIPTGSEELDALLFGGIPQNYAVALTSPSTEEKERLVKRFLEAGTTADEITFFLTTEAGNAKALAEKHLSNFYLFVCNLQADMMVQDFPNVFKLKGIENLTDIDIVLTKAFRTLNPSTKGTKRICIEIVSDVLLQHHAINTRRWLSALLPTLKSKGFTILALVDPQMHPPEETQAVLGLFDGEISIQEKETPSGTARFLKIKRMTNQKYHKDETLLTEE